MGSIVLFDADSEDSRLMSISAFPEKGARVMHFAAKKDKECIARHGPIVMNKQGHIYDQGEVLSGRCQDGIPITNWLVRRDTVHYDLQYNNIIQY